MIALSETSRPAVGTTRPHIQWVLPFSPVVKRPVCAAGRSPFFSVEFKNEWSSTSAPTILYVDRTTLPFPHTFKPTHDRAACRRNTG